MNPVAGSQGQIDFGKINEDYWTLSQENIECLDIIEQNTYRAAKGFSGNFRNAIDLMRINRPNDFVYQENSFVGHHPANMNAYQFLSHSVNDADSTGQLLLQFFRNHESSRFNYSPPGEDSHKTVIEGKDIANKLAALLKQTRSKL